MRPAPRMLVFFLVTLHLQSHHTKYLLLDVDTEEEDEPGLTFIFFYLHWLCFEGPPRCDDTCCRMTEEYIQGERCDAPGCEENCEYFSYPDHDSVKNNNKALAQPDDQGLNFYNDILFLSSLTFLWRTTTLWLQLLSVDRRRHYWWTLRCPRLFWKLCRWFFLSWCWCWDLDSTKK